MANVVAGIAEPKVLDELNETMLRRKVGILGGTFNPPHCGHLIIAEQVRNQLGLEEILFMPSAQPPHKVKKETIAARTSVVNARRSSKRHNEAFSIEEMTIWKKSTVGVKATLTIRSFNLKKIIQRLNIIL
ncbi:MAG: adenylyltransferase/cytidyltransferase family protein [Alkalibacterium sp.]|nr:adenylyltransferase/cytidyltransferase family protein [Alkalibacterium sp.]